MSTFEEVLFNDGKLIYKTKGTSMKPMLHQNRDLVVITAIDEIRPKKHDVALYKRGTQYVLHRIIRITEQAYLIRGDNTYSLETVPKEAVIGVLTEFMRKGKKYSVNNLKYRIYVFLWCALYPVRAICMKARRKIKKVAKQNMKKRHEMDKDSKSDRAQS